MSKRQVNAWGKPIKTTTAKGRLLKLIRSMMASDAGVTVTDIMRRVRRKYQRATVRALLWQQVRRAEFRACLRDGADTEFYREEEAA